MSTLEKLTALKRVSLNIAHNDHAGIYQTAARWLDENEHPTRGFADILPKDREEMLRTGDIWTLQWYPDTPNGFYCVGAATLERCIDLALAQQAELNASGC